MIRAAATSTFVHVLLALPAALALPHTPAQSPTPPSPGSGGSGSARSFLAGGLLEFVFPFSVGGAPSKEGLTVDESTTQEGGVSVTHRHVVLGAGGSLGPKTIPGPELLAHGPLTVYSQPLDGEMRRNQRRRTQDAVPQNADALGPHPAGAVCDGKPGLRCTVFGAPIVFGAIGDGAERRTFLYYQDVGSVGPLLDAAQQLPSPLLAANTWSRPYAFGWQLPQPAIPLSLRSNLTVSDAWLLITDEAAPSAGQRADLFLRLLVLLLPKVRLPFLSDHEGCFATSSGSF